LRALLIYILFSGVVTLLLLQTTGLSYLQKALFVGGVGVAVGALCRLTDWNWHGYPSRYTAVCVADHAICTLLIGLSIAKLT